MIAAGAKFCKHRIIVITDPRGHPLSSATCRAVFDPDPSTAPYDTELPDIATIPLIMPEYHI